jgi:hypothetical protein
MKKTFLILSVLALIASGGQCGTMKSGIEH